jgi:hypothetical protein
MGRTRLHSGSLAMLFVCRFSGAHTHETNDEQQLPDLIENVIFPDSQARVQGSLGETAHIFQGFI